MASPSLSSTFLFLSLLLCTYITASATNTPPPAEAPHPPHHHHHHHHPPPPSPPPSHPPPPPPTYSHPPPPTHPPPPPRSYPHPPPPSHPHPPPPSHPSPTPPAKPPVHPPAKPPAHPPVKPPAHPPVKPPSHPPVKPPAHPPVKPPSHPPVKPPAHPPVKPPSHPPVKPPSPPPKYPPLRKKVAVQGVVYCKSCKFRGVDTLVGAAPLAGAVVKLVCNNTKNSLKELKTTDKNGFFFFMPQSLTTAGSHKCKVSLVSSPRAACNVPTNLHGGAAGALLIRSRKPPVDKRPKILPFELFTVGPFAFEAPKKLPCHY